MLIRDGFPGQRFRVLPRPLISKALRREPTARLLVTDAGHFPRAAMHGRIRPNGAEQVIVILCTDGAGWAHIGGTDLAIRAGQVLVIPPNVKHSYGADENDPWTIWWLHAAGADVPVLVDAVVGDDARYLISIQDPYRAVALAEYATASLERDETTSSLITASGAAWNLLAQLAADRDRGQHTASDRILLAQDYLREHIAAPTSLPELARLAGMSVSHFSALFRAAAGTGVVEYVKRLRSARARELLLTTSLGVAEVATQVGYDDAFYFSRQFRAINGVSPRQFRDAHREAHRPG